MDICVVMTHFLLVEYIHQSEFANGCRIVTSGGRDQSLVNAPADDIGIHCPRML